MNGIGSYLSMSWLYWGLLIAYCITILSIIGIILSENRNPVKSLAWVTVLILLPVGGIVLYLFFGRSIKNTRMISRRNRRRLLQNQGMINGEPDPANLSPEAKQQIQLGRALTGARYHQGNDVKIFFDGRSKFDSLETDIRNARHTIHLQYYIIEDDQIGNRIRSLLIAKAKEGVKVRLIYDHIGSIHVRNRFFKEMTAVGIEAHPFFRVAFPPFATRINWRNHRKISVIDDEIGYIGGMNIADRYITGGKFDSWRDTHLRITGPAVPALQYSFAVDWSFMGQPLIEVLSKPSLKPSGNASVGLQLMTSGPTSEWSNVAFLLLKAIGNAKRRVYIQTPYFLPPESMLRVLQAAALAKVDVRVMIPKKSDSKILTYASFSYIYECIRAGIKIYLYTGGMIHSKVVIIDDDFSSVGSANIDFRSFEHNFEANMFIYSAEVNARLRRQFIADQADSERPQAAEWRKRPVLQKIAESIVRLLSPVL